MSDLPRLISGRPGADKIAHTVRTPTASAPPRRPLEAARWSLWPGLSNQTPCLGTRTCITPARDGLYRDDAPTDLGRRTILS
jgi:hypothetical protein